MLMRPPSDIGVGHDNSDAPSRESCIADRLMDLCGSVVRAYIRYFPLLIGKRLFWTSVIEPYFRPRSHQVIVRDRFGNSFAGDTKDLINGFIYYFGVWEPHLTRWVSSCLREGDTFVDVGANVGYYTFLASRLVGESGVVVAIEASPFIYESLQRNLALNRGLGQVRTVNLAASDGSGVVPVYAGHDDNRGKTTILELEDFPLECFVNCAPLHSILRPEDVKRARIIKVDVEGAESLVVYGFGEILDRGRSDLEIAIEISPQRLETMGRRAFDIVKFFEGSGFHPYTLDNDYSPLSYLKPYKERRPQRLRTDLLYMTDIIFSRRDKDWL